MSAREKDSQKPEPRPVGKGDHVFLVDGSGYIFRAYHALPPLTRPSDGLPVGAVHGFCQMLWKLLKDTSDEFEPTHLAVIFDYSGKSFRNDIYPDYKANRPPAPDDLVPQFSIIRDATRAFNVACIEQEGYEADDLIATYARQALDAGGDVTIVSSDKDLMQLVGPRVVMVDTMKNKRVGEAEVVERFGLGPDKVIEVQALAGDSTDNVPGVPGIGVKTAALLIEEYGDLETLLARAQEIKQNKRRENLIEFADQARISKELVTLKQDVPVDVALDETGTREPVADEILGFMSEMEFTTLTRRVAEALDAEPPPPPAKSVGSTVSTKGKAGGGDDKGGSETASPSRLAARRADEIAKVPVDRSAYETVTDLTALQAWIDQARAQGFVAVDTETDSLDAIAARLVGVSLATAPGRACYVPLQHNSDFGDLFGGQQEAGSAPRASPEASPRTGSGTTGKEEESQQIPLADALAALRPLLEDESVLKIGQNLKYDMLVLAQHDVHLTPMDDTMLLSYALDAGRGKHGMDELALRHLGHVCIPFKEIAGSGKSALTFDQLAIPKATEYAAEDADVTLRLWLLLKPRLAAEAMTSVYETLERPLAPVLAKMEREGVKVDRQILSRLSGNFTQQLGGLEAEIHKAAGEEFNVASPRQLGEILFDKMRLPGGKKTKSGQWETRAGLLDDLAGNEELTDEARTFVAQMLEWRQLAKLKSTYTDALPNHINSQTGRIHTSYAMAATSTGRLASTDPNLQNIPVRTPEGREIRTAFVAEKGNKLISADYSQIELRVLAHMADISALKQAFEDGLDIHAMTASEMFGVPVRDMPPDVRRRAKAINFGIIYGISAFGLANQLSISRGEAGDYIKTYFERFPGIRDYMEATKEVARKAGYVETLFGRKAHYPEINSKNPKMRGFMERAAINAPIQGSAADIIRRAMVRMVPALKKEKLSARMLLQVHDELIFEAPEAEVEKTIEVASDVMENSPDPAVHLAVPLKVDARAADNWDEAH
ncbi:MAG: DNA polymerase I [Hyphomicrobiales bacterium]|nr:DNA polymerase I [Hyphomicrobiales bacterium]